jgi:hypothetical protein
VGLDFLLDQTSSFFIQSKLEVDYTSARYASGPIFFLFPLIAGYKFFLN